MHLQMVLGQQPADLLELADDPARPVAAFAPRTALKTGDSRPRCDLRAKRGRHRLENPGKIDLELIEVQTGSYLGEDDIVRLVLMQEALSPIVTRAVPRTTAQWSAWARH